MGRFGFVRGKDEIKYLTLYAMKQFPFPVDMDSVLDACLVDEAFGYFEFMEAFRELLKTGHILEGGVGNGKKYRISDMGKYAEEVFENDVPRSVREKAERNAVRIVHSIRRNAGIHTSITDNGGGGLKMARMAIGDEDDLVLDLRMAALTDEHCRMLINGFRKNAEQIYDIMLKALLYPDKNSENQDDNEEQDIDPNF